MVAECSWTVFSCDERATVRYDISTRLTTIQCMSVESRLTLRSEEVLLDSSNSDKDAAVGCWLVYLVSLTE